MVGYEIAGEVESRGRRGGGLEPGQRVMGGCRFGGYAELAVTGPGELIPLPDDWSFAEGAAMPVAYATAYAGLVRYGGLRAGERVLIQAAAGGVGIAATQIAKLVGAEVYGTASPSKHDAIRGFGVDHPVDYRTHDVVDEVRRIAGEQEPLDLVFDAHRRPQLQAGLLAAAARRPAGLLRRLGGAGRREPQPRPGAARARADAALQPGQADEPSRSR